MSISSLSCRGLDLTNVLFGLVLRISLVVWAIGRAVATLFFPSTLCTEEGPVIFIGICLDIDGNNRDFYARRLPDVF